MMRILSAEINHDFPIAIMLLIPDHLLILMPDDMD